MTVTSIRIPQTTLACVLFLGLFYAADSRADDWPQWRGPDRDGVWRESGIVETFPASGLKFRWRVRIGRGYSGPVVADGRVFVMDHVFEPEVERVLCFDEVTGERVWDHSYPVDYKNMEYGNGPRASPTVLEGKVYTLGTQGHLFCLDAASGKVLWTKDLAAEYHARVPQYGASVAPLVEGDLLIVCVGGQPDASIIAFDRNSGEERWKKFDDRPAYSAPIVIDRAGRRQAIVWTADNVVSLDATTGNVYWQVPYKAVWNEAQVVASPVLHKDRLLCVMAWNRGSMMLELGAEKPSASVIWTTRKRPTTLFSTPLFIDDDHFYTVDSKGLHCLDANTGDEVWRTTNVTGRSSQGQAHLTPNGNRVFLFNQRGHLISARLTPEGYEELGRTLLVEPTAGHRAEGPVAWAHPAYANKHVIGRNDRELVSASLDADQYPATNTSVAILDVEARVLSEFAGRDAALSLDFSPDGQTLAVGKWNGDMALVDVATGEEKLPAPEGIGNNVSSVTYSPDGNILAYAGGTEYRQVRNNRKAIGKVTLWDVTNGTIQSKLEGHTNKVTSAVFSPDGKTLATASADKTVRLWDAATGAPRSVFEGHATAVWSLAYSPDGKTIVSGDWDGTIMFWDAADGKEIASLKGHEEEILCAAISPDGTTLATGSADWTVRLWDLTTRKERAILKAHNGAIYCLAFSSNGEILATGSGDETVKLWDVEEESEYMTLSGHRSGISAVAFSPGDRVLASAGRDDAVRLWALTANQ